MRRARADGAKGVFVVPTACKAGYWMALQNHSIAMAALNDRASNFVGVQVPLGRHTIFSVDLGDLTRSPSRATPERGVADGRHALRQHNLHRNVRSSVGGSRSSRDGGRAAGYATPPESHRHSRQENPLRQRLPASHCGFGNAEGIKLSAS